MGLGLDNTKPISNQFNGFVGATFNSQAFQQSTALAAVPRAQMEATNNLALANDRLSTINTTLAAEMKPNDGGQGDAFGRGGGQMSQLVKGAIGLGITAAVTAANPVLWAYVGLGMAGVEGIRSMMPGSGPSQNGLSEYAGNSSFKDPIVVSRKERRGYDDPKQIEADAQSYVSYADANNIGTPTQGPQNPNMRPAGRPAPSPWGMPSDAAIDSQQQAALLAAQGNLQNTVQDLKAQDANAKAAAAKFNVGLPDTQVADGWRRPPPSMGAPSFSA